MASIGRISAILGARIEGVDLSHPLADESFSLIENALHEHCFVVMPGQTLTSSELVAFSRYWGRPEPHVIDRFHHPEDSNILILSNVHRDGQPIGLVDAGTYFHTDYSYLDVPARCTILYSIQMPRTGSGTTFANQRQAYADLPEATRQRLEGLVCRHHYGNRDDLNGTSRTVASVLTEAEKQKVSWVRHPLVRRHPHTEIPCLYAVSGSSFEIEGMSADEGRALLRELKAHATQPAYCHTYHYGIGDVIVWDNVQLLHAAPLTDYTDARTLWRVTVKEAGPTL
jgi:taurine dioxygenase